MDGNTTNNIATPGSASPVGDEYYSGWQGGRTVRHTPSTLKGSMAIGVSDVLGLAAAIRDALPYLNILDYGAVAGTRIAADPPDCFAAWQAAVAFGELTGQRRLYVPAAAKGRVYWTSQEWRVPDDWEIFGDGRGKTVIGLRNGANRSNNVITNLGNNRTEDNAGNDRITVRDLTVDGNRTRLINDGDLLSTSGCGIGLAAVRDSILYNVEATSCTRHGVDIAGATYISGGPEVYSATPSQRVYFDLIYASDCGDDNFTTHYSSYLYGGRVYTRDPSATQVPGNSNGVEIDDGSRHISIEFILAIGGDCGLQMKGHNTAPAPYDISIGHARCINNRIGIELRHTGWYGARPDDDGTDGELPTDPEDGEPITFTGSSSATARRIRIGVAEIIAPRANPATGTEARYGVRIRSYEDVWIGHLTISDGADEVAAYQDYQPTTPLGVGGRPIRVYRGARGVRIGTLAINGFKTQDRGLYSSGSLGGSLTIDHLITLGGPQYGVYGTTNAQQIKVGSYYCINAVDSPGISPIRLAGANCQVGSGYYANFSRAPQCPLGETLIKDRQSDGGGTVIPQPFRTTVTREPSDRDLGMGEGARWNHLMALASPVDAELANVDREIGWIGFYKNNDADTSYLHDFIVALLSSSSLGTLTTEHFRVVSNGRVQGGVAGQQFGSVALPWGTAEFQRIHTPIIGARGVDLQIGDSPDTSTALTARWSLDRSTHAFGPVADNVYALGSASLRASVIYAGTGAINTSDEREKQDVTDYPDGVMDAMDDLAIRLYRFRDAVTLKGDDARWHSGVIAQQVEAALVANGQDAWRHAFLCSDPHMETVTVTEMIEDDVYDDVPETQRTERFDVVDGKAVQTWDVAEVVTRVRRMQDLPMVDQHGAPIMVTVGDGPDRQVVQRVARIPVRAVQSRTRTVTRQVDIDGVPQVRMGIRPDELLMAMAAAQRRRTARLEARIAALEDAP